MLQDLLVGLVTMTACLAIQALVVALLLKALLALEKRQLINARLAGASLLLLAVMLGLLVGNLLQITLWATLFHSHGEFESFGVAFYHSVVNFTTLGYGDLVMSEGNRLLGALEALNGVLMIGITTGFLFMVLTGLMQRAWKKRIAEPETDATK
jgi:Ion channel